MLETARNLARDYPPHRLAPEMLDPESSFDDMIAFFTKVQEDCKPTSSPGFPWSRLEGTKGAIIAKHSHFLAVITTWRYVVMTTMDISHLTLRESMTYGVTEVYDVITKNEPHPERKSLQGLWRIVFMAGISNECLHRGIFGPGNKAEIRKWTQIPSKPGMGAEDIDNEVLRSNIREIAEGLEGLDANVVGTDVSAWDTNFRTLFFECFILIRSLNGSWHSVPHLMLFANNLKYHSFQRKVLGMPDGSLYNCVVDGWMPSGEYITSSGNSIGRVCLSKTVYKLSHEGVDPPVNPFAMGDDMAEPVDDPVIQRYASFGMPLKAPAEGWDKLLSHRTVEEQCSSVEFCAWLHSNTSSKRVGLEKCVVAYLANPPTTESSPEQLVIAAVQRYQSFFMNFRHNPVHDLLKVHDLFEDLGYTGAMTRSGRGRDNILGCPRTPSINMLISILTARIERESAGDRD